MKKSILFLALCFFSILGIAQVTPGDSTEYVIKLANGNEYIGYVLKDDGREMLIQSSAVGKLFIKKADIISISKKTESKGVMVDGEVWENNTFSTRYFFSTNGLPIKKGENYYMIHLYGPEFHVAVSNSVNVGIMTTWIGAPFLFTLKKSFPTKRPDVNFAVGSLTGNLSYLSGFKGLMSVNFLSITKGDRENNLTFSSGVLVANNGINADEYQTNVKSSGTLASVAGTLRIGKSTSLIFDSMFGILNAKRTRLDAGYTSDYDPILQTYNSYYYNNGLVTTRTSRGFMLLMPGIRIMQGPDRAFQFYMNYTSIEGNTFGFPMVSWLRKF
jgi:hypothetical protein